MQKLQLFRPGPLPLLYQVLFKPSDVLLRHLGRRAHCHLLQSLELDHKRIFLLEERLYGFETDIRHHFKQAFCFFMGQDQAFLIFSDNSM